MISNKKIIAFDLDGTLAESKTPITQEMANLVKKLTEQKIVVITSGGSFTQFKTQLLPKFEEGFLSSFGQNFILLPTSASQRYEYDAKIKNWVMVDKRPLDEKIKEKVKKLLQGIIDSGLYEIPPNPKGEIIEDRDTQITFSALGQKAGVEEKKSWDPDQRKRKKIKEILLPQLPEVNILINAYSSIDILPQGFHKGIGLKLLLDKLDLQKSDMVYVGDGLFPGGNDYAVHESGIETIAVKGPEEVSLLVEEWIS